MYVEMTPGSGGGGGHQMYYEINTTHSQSGNSLTVTCGFKPRHIEMVAWVGAMRGFTYDAETSETKYWQSINGSDATQQDLTNTTAYGFGQITSTGFVLKSVNSVAYTHCMILATD